MTVAATIFCKVRSEVTVTETVELWAGASQQLRDNSANTSQRFTPTGNPAVQAKSHEAIALTAGTAAIDLLALIGTNGGTIDTTGMRLLVAKIQNPNADALAVMPAGADGYTGFTITIGPQGEALITSTGFPTVSPTCHLLTLSGTDTDVSNWLLVFGTVT